MRTRIREYRAKQGLTQEKLAEMVGVRRETIIFLEQGKYNPSLKLAHNVAGVLGAKVEAVSEFHEVFLDNIKMFGRVNETFLMGVYQMRSTFSVKNIKVDFTGVYKNIGLGLKMLKRGRLSLFPRWKGRKMVRLLFKEG